MTYMDYEDMWCNNRYQEEVRKVNLEVQKATAKATAVEAVRLRSAYFKQQMREEEMERRKLIGDEVQILSNGEMRIVTKNLRIEAKPRSVTNMKSPALTILKRAEDNCEQIFQIEGFIGSREVQIFLKENDAGNATYLMKKFTSAGVSFYLPLAKAKRMATGLLCILLETPKEEKILPDIEGWVKKPDGTFEYVEEGALTWLRALKMSR